MEAGAVRLFLCGDVMTGRGIDQVLPRPSEPVLHEPYAKSAEAYVELAERANGPIARPVSLDYIWGDALPEIDARSPDLRLINLETSITTSEEALPKGINYRMHPANAGCLAAARVDCCALANNHVLDWGTQGLLETLRTLHDAGIATAGAGASAEEAARPAAFALPEGQRLLVFGLGSGSSGIPEDWAATPARPGVLLLPDLSPRTLHGVVRQIGAHRRDGDIVVASIHWGENWSYAVPAAQRAFAHGLLDSGTVDLVHGHSSHHAKGIEVHYDKLILYGCGDFINDYEGIAGHEEFRADLVLAYFASLEASTGRLLGLEMVPFCSRRFRLERALLDDARWLGHVLDREGRAFGTNVDLTGEGVLRLRW